MDNPPGSGRDVQPHPAKLNVKAILDELAIMNTDTARAAIKLFKIICCCHYLGIHTICPQECGHCRTTNPNNPAGHDSNHQACISVISILSQDPAVVTNDPGAVTNGPTYNERMRNALALLTSKQLVIPLSNREQAVVNPSLQQEFLELAGPEEQISTCTTVMRHLGTFLNPRRTRKDLKLRQKFLPQVLSCMKLYEKVDGDSTIDLQIPHLCTFSEVLADNGWCEASSRLVERIVRTYTAKLGPNHPATLNSMYNLANRYFDIGLKVEARELLALVLERQKTVLGEDSIDTVRTMCVLSCRYGDAGLPEKAIELGEKALELCKTHHGELSRETIRVMLNLAACFQECKRIQESTGMYEKVLQVSETALGEDHPDTIYGMHKLSDLYKKSDRLEDAILLIEKLLERRRRVLGACHPETMRTLQTMATWCLSAGRMCQALLLTDYVVRWRTANLGEAHPDTLFSLYSQAHVNWTAGWKQKALTLMEKAVRLHQETLGRQHPGTVAAVAFLEYIHQAGI